MVCWSEGNKFCPKELKELGGASGLSPVHTSTIPVPRRLSSVTTQFVWVTVITDGAIKVRLAYVEGPADSFNHD
ncbi:hypothetical protein ACJ72_02892 [Emergomyces africanus]|uniref:Uncharacterized protein n=1 Tax=Emergomyces africanus TaxID=1955775 RepID=A0A1B7P152_9EURO|nr:hypothetical protein ACJ72_02892 [Emergomyces africanus]